jgi:hypothetical protein
LGYILGDFFTNLYLGIASWTVADGVRPNPNLERLGPELVVGLGVVELEVRLHRFLKPGTDVMIFEIFSPKKLAFLTRNEAKICKNLIITLVCEKNTKIVFCDPNPLSFVYREIGALQF